DLPERLQCDRYLVGRHANTGVFDAKYDAPAGAMLDLQSDLSARRRELDGVGQQVDKDLRELRRIADHRRQRLFDLALELDLRAACHVLNDLRAERHDLANIDLLLG